MSTRTTLAALIVGCATALAGCSSSNMYLGGASTERTGVSTYAGSTLTTTDRVPVGRAFLATRAACEDMGLLIVEEESSSWTATVTARDEEDRKVTLMLDAATEQHTTIAVRVKGGKDRAANKELAVAIFKAIRGNYS